MSSESEGDTRAPTRRKTHNPIPDLAYDARASAPRKKPVPRPPSSGGKAAETALMEVRRKLMSEGRVLDEFQRAQWRAGSNRKQSIAARPDAAAQNRYYDSLPFDFNRVILFREDDHDTGYINASHLESPVDEPVEWNYIVAQGPMEHTTNDFWEMVWMKNSPLIIMLTNEVEPDITGDMKSKSERYWPDDEDIDMLQVYFRVMVELKTIEKMGDDLVRRHFQLRCIYSSEVREVDHYHYTGWKDIHPPEKTHMVRKLLKIVSKSGCLEKDHQSPAIIHCNSAVGRSMTFVAMSIALKKISEAEPWDSAAGKEAVDMFATIVGLRKLRNSAVHSKDLVLFIYRVIRDELEERLAAS